MSNNQAESNEKGLKILWIPQGGPIITQLDNQTILESEGKSLTARTKKQDSLSNQVLSTVTSSPLIIHLDWMVDFEDNLFPNENLNTNCQFIGSNASSYNWTLDYIMQYQLRMKNKYPFDKWGIFANRTRNLEKNLHDIERIFSAEDFGINFISHAHVDHSPLNNIARNHGDSEEGMVEESSSYYIFPVLCTPFTEKILNERFKMKINREIMRQFASADESNTNPELSQRFKPNLNDVHKQVKEYLDHFHSCYIDSLDINSQFGPVQNDYFHPIYYNDLALWLIPNGHVMGSAGLCIRKISQESRSLELERSIRDELLQIDADFTYLGEFCPIHRPHCLSCPPLHSDIVMIDALFADPLLNIPDQTEEIDRLKRWIKEEIQQNPLIFYCYDLGKPQLIAALVNEINQESQTEEIVLVLPADAKRLIDLGIQNGLHTSTILTRQEARKAKYPQEKNYVLIASPNERDSSATKSLVEKRNAKIAEITGWCYDPEYCTRNFADNYFCISDHVTYPDLMMYLHQSAIQKLVIVNEQTPRVEIALLNEGYQIISEHQMTKRLIGQEFGF